LFFLQTFQWIILKSELFTQKSFEFKARQAYNVEGFAQAGEIKTTPRPSDTKIHLYFSEASTHQACAKPAVIGWPTRRISGQKFRGLFDQSDTHLRVCVIALENQPLSHANKSAN